jgi:general secretion pathway protein G
MRRSIMNAGFTLIEIMVVVFILGLLVTLVAPKIIGKTDQARVTKAKADIKGIEQALHMFRLDNGFYPSTGEGLAALITAPPNATNFDPDGYLDKIPVDPWGEVYVYASDGRNFVIKSLGRDRIEGGEGYDADISNADID